VLILAFAAFCWCYGGTGANQKANFDLTRAMVERHTFAIDAYSGWEGDVAFGPGGHIYSNKPPGLSLLAAVPYQLLHGWERARGLSPDVREPLDKHLVTIVVAGLCGALI